MVAGRRVLVAQSTAERYGSDLAALELTRGLVSRGWAVTIALPERGSLAADLEAAGGQVVLRDPGALRRVLGPRGWIRFAITFPLAVLRHAALARRADVVHVNVSTALAAGFGGRLAGRPVVWHMRESYAEHRGAWRWLARTFVRPTAAAVLATSSDIAAEARAAGLDATVVYDGLSFRAATPGPTPEGAVLAVGRINDWKGHDVLVEAIARMRARGVDVEAEIAGDVFPGGEVHRTRLEADIARLSMGGAVRLLGFVNDVPTLLATASIFVQPSRRPEPFGLALVEAMAAGLPCIATDAGGPREIIRPGDTGLLVPPGDAEALAEAITSLRDDPDRAAAMGTRAAADVRARFSADRMVEQVEQVYRSLLEDRRPRRSGGRWCWVGPRSDDHGA